jgi:serine/threonine protein kinase
MEEPEQIGPYRVEERLGSGGTADVYRVRRGDESPVALKLLHADLCENPDLVHRFRREAGLLSRLSHPNIVPVLDAGAVGNRQYLVMPLLSCPTLEVVLARTGPIRVPGPDAGLLEVPVRVLMALEAIHTAGIIHRDITTRNIFVPEGSCLLSDFGVAKVVGSDSLPTASGVLVGTLPYMAPEQLWAQAATVRTDIYQLGLVLYRMVAGSLPFELTVPDSIRAKCLEESLPDPRTRGATLTDRLADVILKATARAPEKRFTSAVQMAMALERSCKRG